MSESTQTNEYKLLILDRIKDPAQANSVMELIANNHGDEALSAVISDMESIDVARMFTEAFDYSKPNQAAPLLKPDKASECILAIMARRSSGRVKEDPRTVAADINDFFTSVILTRPKDEQLQFKKMVNNHMDLICASLLCQYGYQGDSLLECIKTAEHGTLAEVALNLGLMAKMRRTVKAAIGWTDESASDANFVNKDGNFIENTFLRWHQVAIEKYDASTSQSMEDFMDM
jgi:hypothetical protein